MQYQIESYSEKSQKCMIRELRVAPLKNTYFFKWKSFVTM